MGRAISSGQRDACRREALLAGSWLAGLPREIAHAVLENATSRSLAAGEPVYRQGDTPTGLFGIVSGQIQTIGAAEDGQQSLLSVLRGGEWTGFMGLLNGKPYQFTTQASMPTEIAFLPAAAVKAIFGQEAQTTAMLAAPLFALLRVAYGYLVETNGRPPVRVVAQRLLDLGRCVYLPGSVPAPVLEAISQDDIAAATYLTRPTVNRALRELEGGGAIRLGYGRVEICSVPALFDVASGQPAAKRAPQPRPPAPASWSAAPADVRSAQLDGILHRGGWFPSLPHAKQNEITKALRLKHFTAGETIYRAGDPPLGLAVMITGQARIWGDAGDGSRLLMSLLHPGEWSGFLPMLDSGPQPLSMIASRSSTVGLLPLEMIQQLFHQDRAGYDMLLAPVLQVLRYTYEYLIETNRRSPARLVAQRLFDLARNAYLPEIKPRDFVDNLTQDDLALATGLTRPTVNRVMKELTTRGIIAIGYGKITIRNPKALIDFARV
jgi:CRP/FNR family transcriptional regulator, cyclic AMP receptor protein